MVFEILNESHAAPLLEFEMRNRSWFESLIAQRNPDFYSADGVAEHIEENIESMNRGRCMALVLVRDSEIIARANLKDICRDSQTAEVGYRVAKDSTGQGVGTRCVGGLIQEAMSLKFLSKIRGYVLDNNPGSARILQKHGFQSLSYTRDFFTIQGSAFGVTIFQRRLK